MSALTTFYIFLISVAYAVIGYILGNITFGAIVARLFKKNIRTMGSGNVGATNVARTISKKWGLFVLLMDAIKTYAAVICAWGIFIVTIDVWTKALGTINFYPLVYVAGFFSIFGHCYPIKYIVCLLKHHFKASEAKAYSGG